MHTLFNLTSAQSLFQGAMSESYGPQREKTCLRGFANNKGTDQPVHPHSLISAFGYSHIGKNHYLDLLWANFNILASLCSWADWFEFHFVGDLEDRFSPVAAHISQSRSGGFIVLIKKKGVNPDHLASSEALLISISTVLKRGYKFFKVMPKCIN